MWSHTRSVRSGTIPFARGWMALSRRECLHHIGKLYFYRPSARLYPFWTAGDRHGKLYDLYDNDGRSSMLTLRKEFVTLMTTFAPLFTKRVWQYVQVLLIGAILSPGQRTVTAALRVMGLAQAKFFQQYHRVLNRAVWSSLEGSRLLLHLLVHTLARTGPLVMGLDDTIERRRGAKIRVKGIDRDPVRSSHSHVVKASGLRW